MPLRTAGRANPWQMLLAAMVAQVTATAVVSTPLLLIPHLHLEEGWPLVAGATLAAAPTIGTLATLVAWGALVDRLGERISLLTGLTVLVAGAAVTVIGARAGSTLALGLGFALCGVAAASSNSASGRLVVGWFPAHRRGVAMGIRQTGLPLGVGVAALVVPAWWTPTASSPRPGCVSAPRRSPRSSWVPPWSIRRAAHSGIPAPGGTRTASIIGWPASTPRPHCWSSPSTSSGRSCCCG